MYPDPIFLNVHLYGVMIAVGILCAFFVLYLYSAKKRLDGKFVDFIFYNGVVSVTIGLISTRIVQAVYDYIDNPKHSYFYYLKHGGMTFIGGLLGGALCFFTIYCIVIFAKKKKYNSSGVDILPVLPCCVTIGHAFGRIGCFFAGCCYGKETDSWIGIKFKYFDHKVIPTQLIESIFLFILFAVCSVMFIKYNFRHNMSLYLIAYGTFRFFIEYLRGDYRGKFIGSLSPSQFWSILIVLFGIAMIFIVNFFVKKKEKQTGEIVQE